MASELSTFAAAYATALVTTRGSRPSLDDYIHDLEYRVDTLTITEAANAAGDYYDLGPVINENVIVVPELSGVRYPTGSTGTMTDVVLTLAKIDTAGTIVDLTGPLTASGAIGERFTDFAAATTLPTCSAEDHFILRVTSITTLTAGRTLQVEIAFHRKN